MSGFPVLYGIVQHHDLLCALQTQTSELLEQSIMEQPARALPLFVMGLIHQRTSEVKAAAVYRRCLQIDPKVSAPRFRTR